MCLFNILDIEKRCAWGKCGRFLGGGVLLFCKKVRFMTRRLFIFAAYDKDNIVDDSVMFYLRALSGLGDIVFMADNDLSDDELARVRMVPNVLYAGAMRHGEYDFGSYRRAFGWAKNAEILNNYDWVWFVNDSVYGPVGNLDKYLAELESYGAQFVGMLANSDKNTPLHIQSWFMGICRDLARQDFVHDFWQGVKRLENKNQICMKYEVGFSELMRTHGIGFKALLIQNSHKCNMVYRKPCRALRAGLPFIKKSALKNMFGFDVVARFVKNQTLLNAIIENANRCGVAFKKQGWFKRLFV